eukprot:TRINITY_DN31254_c0_g1_i1.p1 TRINITY_DN31254_c0_g1~~TRINITY_DN31254_c0_g1_i1.p1  ORF type:complete len:283 (-),score=48.93 TRINITY_DN31254_c0_g1_i1:38-886(-)
MHSSAGSCMNDPMPDGAPHHFPPPPPPSLFLPSYNNDDDDDDTDHHMNATTSLQEASLATMILPWSSVLVQLFQQGVLFPLIGQRDHLHLRLICKAIAQSVGPHIAEKRYIKLQRRSRDMSVCYSLPWRRLFVCGDGDYDPCLLEGLQRDHVTHITVKRWSLFSSLYTWLTQFPSLVHIQFNDLYDQNMMTFIDEQRNHHDNYAPFFSHLREIIILKASNITDSTLLSLAEACPSLCMIHLGNAPSITREGATRAASLLHLHPYSLAIGYNARRSWMLKKKI